MKKLTKRVGEKSLKNFNMVQVKQKLVLRFCLILVVLSIEKCCKQSFYFIKTPKAYSAGMSVKEHLGDSVRKGLKAKMLCMINSCEEKTQAY